MNFVDPDGYCPENPWWNDLPGQRCVWLANELHQQYGWSLDVLMEKDVIELETVYAAGNANSTFNESSWSQTVRNNPLATGVVVAGAVVLVAITLAGGAIVVVPIVTSAIAGAATGGITGLCGI